MSFQWFEQETETSCVAACVRMSFANLSVNISESNIRELFGSPILGISLARAELKLSEFGARVKLDGEMSLDDLRDAVRNKIYPIVGVERHIFGFPNSSHAVIVTEVTSREVEFYYPLENNSPLRFSRETFDSAWRLSGKEALMIYSTGNF